LGQVIDKDIKKFTEHISLKSLTYSKVINTWISEDKELYVQLAVDSNTVATQIQNTSKLLFDVNKMLYQYFLSNRANKEIIQYLEN
jgi:putative methionine-R-sulfoxide reductase with GAF domain